ncbi:enoyl-CoA hydratase/isomerase family protein [Vibrio paucivorans]|uniref:3-hydroxyisobutyryl-CoA hydrolase n=1 Tax=Vibrio paucivorans TaxID=2829489 RepID=A0A9X3CI94_9VIBR|nr:enoyl-CoA hydratase/isomerase family protein [Vibrio paucivorans]MCW8335285.1 enoyl-CoA hydratase/isomerase family protein [Vibrio paucivorans]
MAINGKKVQRSSDLKRKTEIPKGAGQVAFRELPCENGYSKIAIATLDNPSSLNALSFHMLVELKQQLEQWQRDPSIACVVLEGSGEKAFCAGGDVRAMYDVMYTKSKAEAQEFFEAYFTVEYQCDYLIHTYSKPLIAWGEGIVMGGGMGLYMGAEFKVVTPKSRLAMPEINIGLYPDVGGTWLLNQLDQGVGLFLGLTGSMVNATDAEAIGFADAVILPEHKQNLFEQLQHIGWEALDDESQAVKELIYSLSKMASADKPDPLLIPYLDAVKFACMKGDVVTVVGEILSLDVPTTSPSYKWFESAKSALRSGSPITAHICFAQTHQYRLLSLADCFRFELGLSVRCGLLGEFQEGVRARLIDKDGNPNWLYKAVDEVPNTTMDELFAPLWTESQHPLRALGQIQEEQ